MATTQSFIVPTSLYNNFDDTEMIVEFNDKGMFLQPFGLELFTHENVYSLWRTVQYSQRL